MKNIPAAVPILFDTIEGSTGTCLFESVDSSVVELPGHTHAIKASFEGRLDVRHWKEVLSRRPTGLFQRLVGRTSRVRTCLAVIALQEVNNLGADVASLATTFDQQLPQWRDSLQWIWSGQAELAEPLLSTISPNDLTVTKVLGERVHGVSMSNVHRLCEASLHSSLLPSDMWTKHYRLAIETARSDDRRELARVIEETVSRPDPRTVSYWRSLLLVHPKMTKKHAYLNMPRL